MGGLYACARRHGAPFLEEVGLIGARRRGTLRRVTRLEGDVLLGDDSRRPVLVGDADPAACALEQARLLGLLLDVVVGVFLHAGIADDADEAFVQHHVAFGPRLARARGERIGEQRHSLFGLVVDDVADGEHEVFVHRDDAAEHEPLAVVPRQRHRLVQREGFAVCRPHGVGAGRGDVRSGLGDEAGLDEVWIGPPGGVQERDGRAAGLDGLAVIAQAHVVDAAAAQVDRTREARRVDAHARNAGERLLAAGALNGDRRRGGRAGNGCGGRGGSGCRSGRRRRGAGSGRARSCARGRRRGLRERGGRGRLGLLLGLPLPLGLGHAVEIIPADDDQKREAHGHEKILLVVTHSAKPCVGISGAPERRLSCGFRLVVASRPFGPLGTLADKAHGARKLTHEPVEPGVERLPAGDDHIIKTGARLQWRCAAHGLAQAAAHPVALHRVRPPCG